QSRTARCREDEGGIGALPRKLAVAASWRDTAACRLAGFGKSALHRHGRLRVCNIATIATQGNETLLYRQCAAPSRSVAGRSLPRFSPSRRLAARRGAAEFPPSPSST